ncbi:MAG: PrsW family glutamic-type intramembrane protease [Candidatus Bathyarchaeota archaeon]|nr:PrsW family glutamic-type intramembrane protease [Candidatus Termiticorpusculum sp.]
MGDNSTPECVIPVHNPPLREKLFFFVSGLLVSVPFALFLSQFYDFLPLLVSSALIAPFIEELAKVFPLFYRHGETEHSIVTLGILVGLGFGLTEFFLYTVLLGVSPFVRLSGIIFHASSAGITAYGIAKKKPLLFYLIASGLHVLNNFVAIADVNFFFAILVQIVVLILAYYLAVTLYRKASKTKMIF